MNILRELQSRFLTALTGLVDQPADYLDQIRRSQDPKFGDYQANFAMQLKAKLGKNPREIAQDIINRVDLADLCEPPEIAGPGFINLRLKDTWLTAQLNAAVHDPRLGIPAVAQPQTYVVDYSGPNVAKPMHVGHIRSTVIGDALLRVLRFVGHTAVGDNHIGDWGTQFGMILYGYRNFANADAYRDNAVQELARLYRLVRQLVDYHAGKAELPDQKQRLAKQEQELAAQRTIASGGDPAAKKKAEKTVRQLERSLTEAREELASLEQKLAAVESSPELFALAQTHANVGKAVLEETAKLHAGDPENVRLWQEFLPPCRVDIDRIYKRLHVEFDHTLGESFYHDRLGAVVADFKRRGLASESGGATCVFLPGQATPMLIQKQDGAFLYATTDLATIQYRMEQWRPKAMLYVVDHRQSLHFEQLFAAAKLWGFTETEFNHVSFGTVLGSDGRPFKTRAGDTVGLEGLLDEAIARAYKIVCDNDDKKEKPELSTAERQRIAEAVGIGALKYADLSQNRTSDYEFSYDKMLAMNGNTATYMQYAHSRVRSIFAKGGVQVQQLLADPQAAIGLTHPAERALAIELLGFAEALAFVLADYRPNVLTTYLFELANRYSAFFENCPVLKAETLALRNSRLLLCELTARTLKQGLELLGIHVVERM